MRNFKDITVIPASSFIAVDGEGYTCTPFDVLDLQGSVRIVPAARILAIHWWGDHASGQVEGFGLGEGFSDRAQVEPYLRPWLLARAAAKREALAVLVRTQHQMAERAERMAGVIAGLKEQIAGAKAELKAAEPGRKAQAQGVVSELGRHLVAAEADAERSAKAASIDTEIAAARAEAEAADAEAKTS